MGAGVVNESSRAVDPFSALGDPNRRRIVELLAERPRSVAELAREIPISRPAISRHLKLLKGAELVADQPEGTRRIYRLREEGAASVEAYVRQVWGEAVARFRLAAENTSPPRRTGDEP